MKVSDMVNDISYTEIGRKGIKTILVPTDFSKPSDAALQIAVDLAKQQNAKLHLLHVVPFRQAANEMEMMQKQLAKFPELKPVEIIPETRKGKIHEEILKAQIEKNVDLIVIARHEKKHFCTLFFPSVTEKVKKTAQCSALVVGF
jgi:nucleotide-binding universal stress UspA family protein